MELERKFAGGAVALEGAARIEGYASLFGAPDQGGDAVAPGAFAGSLGQGRAVRLLWQHDPAQPIGVWEELREDARGLFVRGRLLTEVARGREAAALLKAGAIEGLSIGYRTRRAERRAGGRLLTEAELWEVSLVTFPMLPAARAEAKEEAHEDGGAAALRALAEGVEAARRALRG